MQLPLNAIIRQIEKEQEKFKAIYEEAQKQMPGSEKYQDHDLVFCTFNGSPIDGTKLTKQFQRLLAKNGLPKIRFHGLRHTFATMCRAAGMELGDVQDLLGHADISTTKKLYTHVEIEPLQQAMSKLKRYMSS